MKKEKKTETDVDKVDSVGDYIDHIRDEVFGEDFSDKTAYGEGVSRIFSDDSMVKAEQLRKFSDDRRRILKEIVAGILTILYSKSEEARHEIDKDVDDISKRNIEFSEEEKENFRGSNIVVEYDFDSLADKIARVLNTSTDIEEYKKHLSKYISQVNRMIKTMCDSKDTKVNIVSIKVEKNNIVFTVDYISDDSVEKEMNYLTIPTWSTDFGKKVANALAEYSEKNGIKILVGLDSIIDASGKGARKSIRVLKNDADIINDDSDEYNVEFVVVDEEINERAFTDFMADNGVVVPNGLDKPIALDRFERTIGGETIKKVDYKYDVLFVKKEDPIGQAEETDSGVLKDEDNPVSEAVKKPLK